jgi:hypothetical protein
MGDSVKTALASSYQDGLSFDRLGTVRTHEIVRERSGWAMRTLLRRGSAISVRTTATDQHVQMYYLPPFPQSD